MHNAKNARITNVSITGELYLIFFNKVINPFPQKVHKYHYIDNYTIISFVITMTLYIFIFY